MHIGVARTETSDLADSSEKSLGDGKSMMKSVIGTTGKGGHGSYPPILIESLHLEEYLMSPGYTRSVGASMGDQLDALGSESYIIKIKQ